MHPTIASPSCKAPSPWRNWAGSRASLAGVTNSARASPRACAAFLVTQLPAHAADGQIRNHSYEGFALDQDTGGAIRAAGRCDVFMGTGPDVGELAGRTFAEGKLYYIFVKQDGGPSTMLAGPSSPSAAANIPADNPGS